MFERLGYQEARRPSIGKVVGPRSTTKEAKTHNPRLRGHSSVFEKSCLSLLRSCLALSICHMHTGAQCSTPSYLDRNSSKRHQLVSFLCMTALLFGAQHLLRILCIPSCWVSASWEAYLTTLWYATVISVKDLLPANCQLEPSSSVLLSAFWFCYTTRYSLCAAFQR